MNTPCERGCPSDRESGAKGCGAPGGARAWVLFLLGVGGTAAALASPLPLAIDGQPNTEIIVEENAPATIRFAAQELADHLRLVTGAAPYISPTVQHPSLTRIYMGCPAYSKVIRERAEFAADLARLGGTDGYAVRARGAEIFLFAAQPKGVLNGVYDFLERNSDLIWFRPSAPPVFTSNPNLAATATDFLVVPRFVVRGFQINKDVSYEPSELWMARNRCNHGGAMGRQAKRFQPPRDKYAFIQEFGGGHNLPFWIPFKTYFATNPDFFSLVGGKRRDQMPVQLCFTNPRLMAEMAKNVMEQVRKDGPGAYACYNIMINDCDGVCECPECRKPLALEDGTTLVPDDPAFRSTQHFIFINKVTEEVCRQYPDVVINTYAYMFTVVPPKVKLHRNVAVRYCPALRNDKEPLTGPSNAQWLERTRQWAKQCERLTWREYFGLGAKFPRPISEVVAKDLSLLAGLGVTRAFAESVFDEDPANASHEAFDVSAMEYWVISRLYWDPEQDVGKLRNAFLERTFREAAPAMKEFYELIRKSWYEDNKGSFFLDNPLKSADHYLIKKGLDAPCREALARAEELARHPESKKQVHATRAVFEMWMKKAPLSRTPEIAVPKMASPPPDEFDPDDPWWKKAGAIGGLKLLRTGEPAKHKTLIRLAHDGANLYLGFKCDNPSVEGMSYSRERMAHDQWPKGEHVEVFIDGGLAEKGVYYFLVFDAAGNQFDGIGTDPQWNGKWDVKTKIGKDSWTALVTLPLETIGVNVTQQSRLRALFYKQTNNERPKLYEGASWGGGGLHSPAGFGDLNLAWE